MPEIVVDAKNMLCPMPIIKLATAIKGVAVGGTVRVLATDRGFKPDVTAWCRGTKHELVELSEAEGVLSALIRRTR